MKLMEVGKLDPTGKRVFVRVDWNVTMGKALSVVDDTRIVRTKETIEYLLDKGAKQVILCSHLGKAFEKRSIVPVAKYAEKVLGREIKVCSTVPECHSATEQLVMLENIRLWEGEEGKVEQGTMNIEQRKEAEKALKMKFSKQLASLADCYVNEAFGECHRESASIVGVAKLLPAYAGFNLVREVETILGHIESPERPLVIVMGGGKVEDKIKLLEVMSQKADTLLLGGKLANEFVKREMKVTGSARVITPSEGCELLDIGEETRKMFAEVISKAKTVVWNGPMGKVEEEAYKAGTHAVYEALTKNEPAYVIVGGGDTLAAIHDEKHLSRIDFVSTGGGAMLKLMEKGDLVGLEPLKI